MCSKTQIKLCQEDDCEICFWRSFASYFGQTKYGKLKLLCWSSRNKLKPRQITKGSGKKFWFRCPECKHVFDSILYGITGKKGTWCPYCSKTYKKLCNDIDCELCFNNSFASYMGKTPNGILKVKCWSDKNKLKPRQTTKGSSRVKFWFDCPGCNHDFDSPINDITKKKSHWCPYCSSKNLCDDIDCDFCFNKSFVSYTGRTVSGILKVKCWSNKNKLKPRQVTKQCNKKFFFDCPECEHVFDSVLASITRKVPRWCPYCSKPCKKLCDDVDCGFCFDNSFASYTRKTNSGILKVECWSDKNKSKPRQVTKSSSKKFWFDCPECEHIFDSVLYSITSKDSNWCPHCKNKTELKLFNYLKKKYSSVQREKKFGWCKNEETGNYFRFDFYLSEFNILIELDGRQHFEQVSNWDSPTRTIDNDRYKMDKANENNLSVIRIIQEDVLSDQNDWKNKLNTIIRKYSEASNFFIGCEKKYSRHS
jgi:very-short-patch-repair endonuclease/DNA-directed RNA polymerase subunit RPC12/RpoP